MRRESAGQRGAQAPDVQVEHQQLDVRKAAREVERLLSTEHVEAGGEAVGEQSVRGDDREAAPVGDRAAARRVEQMRAALTRCARGHRAPAAGQRQLQHGGLTVTRMRQVDDAPVCAATPVGPLSTEVELDPLHLGRLESGGDRAVESVSLTEAAAVEGRVSEAAVADVRAQQGRCGAARSQPKRSPAQRFAAQYVLEDRRELRVRRDGGAVGERRDLLQR